MRSPLAAAFAVLAAPALAQSNGTYSGTLACERMQGRAASNAPFQLTVEGGQARFSREVLAIDGSPMGIAEEAKAPVAPDGMLVLAATIEAGSFHYESRYEGRLGEASGKLAGTQAWPLGKDRPERKCTITLSRRAAAAPPRGRAAPSRPEPSGQERPAQERPVQDRPARARPPARPAEGRPGLDMNVPLDLPPPR